MSEWLKVEWGEDRAQTWIRGEAITAIDVGASPDGSLVLSVSYGGSDDRRDTSILNVKSASFVNTADAGPKNYFVSRSCGGCE